MLAAKAVGIDSCPMIGFKKDELIEELHIPSRYLPVMMITLGYGIASARDTIRLPLEEIVIKETL
jgi:nitroreductase